MGEHLVIWRDNLCNCGFDSSTNWAQLSASSLQHNALLYSALLLRGMTEKGRSRTKGFGFGASLAARDLRRS